ncbi:hypothetical protein AvCA_37170 [Azotobacter vinelandii CA]|uniref:Uncharacterized protein n=2 Tax=Azotobacter vinelandii TaxID=354 RepID=C1DRY8_AZOVD|nr:hypothetical protein [Azotobacter vinelandii]ACO79863.1 hypothetical protein Avin_37170 [Azotobacter vinelandii DJ]AGK16187.1 hypothetical protein AvCA_37170 [Azotobacter vinelandii CA]AGK21559.1 hypothetical protein AvCA6_37170 [Azotobacter vinelandii CA6]SFX43933.1 hypothetical protein SAMN04244547_01576 [Azotobacter vinelandii]GLK62330.1 hypothetical protein GCM10017624_44940 [Azotobacter vinelandii]
MQETRQDLVEQAEAKPRPLLEFRRALCRLEEEHQDLIREQKKFTELKNRLGEAYRSAVSAAENIGERLPKRFRLGDLDVHFNQDGNVTLEHKPAAETWDLLTLAKKAGEQE